MNSTALRSPRVPAKRVYRGASANLTPVILSAAKNLASPPVKLRSTRLRACRIVLTHGRSFSPAASYFLSTATISNQETPPRSLRPAIGYFCKFTLPSLARHRAFSNPRPGPPWPGVRPIWSDIESLHMGLTPALLGRGGRFRQAIPGLSKTASASLPRPRLRAAIPPRPVMLGAARRGGESTAKALPHQKQNPNIQLSHSRGSGNPVLAVRAATTPHPNPLPQGERGLKAGRRILNSHFSPQAQGQ